MAEAAHAGVGFSRRGLPLPPAKGLGSAVSWISNGHFSKFSDLFLFVRFFSENSGGVQTPKTPPYSYGLDRGSQQEKKEKQNVSISALY